jgi:hypothetical protein
MFDTMKVKCPRMQRHAFRLSLFDVTLCTHLRFSGARLDFTDVTQRLSNFHLTLCTAPMDVLDECNDRLEGDMSVGVHRSYAHWALVDECNA